MNGELAHRADFAQYAEERTMRLLTINIHSHGSDFEPELYHQKMKALAAFMKGGQAGGLRPPPHALGSGRTGLPRPGG